MKKSIVKRFICVIVALACLFCISGVKAAAESDGRLLYRCEDGGAAVTGIVSAGLSELLVPSEIDGLTVTAVDDWAFEKNPDIISVIIESGAARIGDGAFSGCTALKGIALPDTVSLIGWDSFSYCTALESIVLPDGVKSVGGFAFSGCKKLRTVEIGTGVTRIDFGAFENCPDISDVYYPLKKTDRSKMTVLPGNDAVKNAFWHYENSETGIKAGDVNGDGQTDNKDLTRLFQYLSGWDVAVQTFAPDTNADSEEDNKDLTRLFQHLSGWDVDIY